MQDLPLLEKLDWIFTSANWSINFPNTLAYPLARVSSDHIPIHIQVGSDIPKASIFRFENYWMEFDGFYETVLQCWNRNQSLPNSANDITARFKCLRLGLKKWSKNLSKLNTNISACNYVLYMMDGIEDQRALSIMEANFKIILKQHILKLLEVKRIYWKSRFKMRSVRLDDENTDFFHAMATQSYRKNYITNIVGEVESLSKIMTIKLQLFGGPTKKD